MMHMSTRTRAIEITVDPQTGAQEYQAEGFVGPACLEPASWAESVLGAPVVAEKTPEFHQAVQVVQQEQQRLQGERHG
jgi:hypothetical protein